ncbi:MAG: phosphotransferase [Acidimicrobiia bacterium]
MWRKEASGGASRRDQAARMMTPAVVEALSVEWGLGPWRSVSRVAKGRTNLTLAVDTDRGRFALRVSHRRKTRAGLDFEVALLEHLRGAGYPAPRVVPTAAGDPYSDAGPEGLFCLVTGWIPGVAYDPRDPSHLAEAGLGLGRYHRAVAGFTARFASEAKARLADAVRTGPADMAAVVALSAGLGDRDGHYRLAAAVEAILPSFAAVPALLPAAGLTEVAIHGSYGRSALLFDGPRLAAALDYDRASWEWRALDIVYALKGFASDPDLAPGSADVRISPERARAFLSAYLGAQPLAADELSAIPAVLRAQRLIRVAGKAAGLLRRHAHTGVPERTGAVAKLAENVEADVRLMEWVADRGHDLLPV